jgi:hypothetical protein
VRKNAALRKDELQDFVAVAPKNRPALKLLTRAQQDVSHGHLCDLPPCVHGLTVGVWAVFFVVLFATFWSSASAIFNIAVATAYAAVFFGLPAVMGRMHPERPRAQPTLAQFLKGRFETLYGPVSGVDALLQILVVPVSITAGAIVMGIIIASARAAS